MTAAYRIDGRDVRARIELAAGQTASFVLDRVEPDEVPVPYSDAVIAAEFDATVAFWRNWLRGSRYSGRWRETVHRSALALKLLAPYKDFHRSTFGALTYYAFNTAHEPFDDVRVREALALAIDRERVSRDDLGGATEPAGKFLPEAMSGEKPVVDKAELLEHDINKARELLADAGYPNGDGFPVIRLLINRNEQQRIVAQSIAAMWRSALVARSMVRVRPVSAPSRGPVVR